MLCLGRALPATRGNGGMGRRCGLKNRWPHGRAGSSPAFRTLVFHFPLAKTAQPGPLVGRPLPGKRRSCTAPRGGVRGGDPSPSARLASCTGAQAACSPTAVSQNDGAASEEHSVSLAGRRPASLPARALTGAGSALPRSLIAAAGEPRRRPLDTPGHAPPRIRSGTHACIIDIAAISPGASPRAGDARRWPTDADRLSLGIVHRAANSDNTNTVLVELERSANVPRSITVGDD